MVGEVVPSLLLLDGHSFEFRVVPDQRPEVLGINLAQSFEPSRDPLRLLALKSLRETIEQVVVAVEMAAGMCARILRSLMRAGQSTFEDIAKIKNVIAVGQH